LVSDKPVPEGYATLYANMLPKLIPVARQHGYCFAIHGSLAADLDAVCVPWVEEASEMDVLVQALAEVCGAFVLITDSEESFGRFDGAKKPHIGPHNRHTFTLSFGGAVYMDLTVMPKVSAAIGEVPGSDI
jgi:hypothetical protein